MQGAKNNLQFTGDDYFADKDVCSIVLEVPNSALGPKEFGLWARTLRRYDGSGSRWIAERGLKQTVILVEEKTMPTSPRNQRTMRVSLPVSRTLWSTQADIRRLRRSGWRGNCCQNSAL